MDLEIFFNMINAMIEAARKEADRAKEGLMTREFTESDYMYWEGITNGLMSARFAAINGRPPLSAEENADIVDRSNMQ